MKFRHPVVRGHPLHAMSSDFPIGILPLAFAASVAARVWRSRETPFAARAATAAALASVAPAVLLGWWEWLTIPVDHEARRPATTHGLMNSAAAGFVALAALWPARRVEMLGTAIACMTAGAWLGGELVFHHGWRVRKAELLEGIEEGKTLDEAERALEQFERAETFLPR
jgi:uncharacterized membrane protein